jgi:hypothetical protein
VPIKHNAFFETASIELVRRYIDCIGFEVERALDQISLPSFPRMDTPPVRQLKRTTTWKINLKTGFRERVLSCHSARTLGSLEQARWSPMGSCDGQSRLQFFPLRSERSRSQQPTRNYLRRGNPQQQASL